MKSIIHDKLILLEEMRERVEYLERENKRLMQEIKDTDRKMDTDSRNLLEKHEQFMEKLARLKQSYESEVVVARDMSESKVRTLQRELDVLEVKLEDEVNCLIVMSLIRVQVYKYSFVNTVEPVNNGRQKNR